MKRYLLLGLASLVVAGGLVTVTPTPADAFTCYARSARAIGWSSSVNLSRARGRALAQCYARTPNGYGCRITGCRWR